MMKDKNKYRKFVNAATAIYGVLTFDELYKINKYLKFNFTKKGLFSFCIDEIDHQGGEIEYLFNGIEFPKYHVVFNKGNPLVFYKNISMEEAYYLLDFKYPIYFDYLLDKEDFFLTADRRTSQEYNDIIPDIVCELYDSLSKDTINSIVDYAKIEGVRKKELRTTICRLIYHELFSSLNLEYASLLNDETVDEFMKRIINNCNENEYTIDSTLFALIPYDKAKYLIQINFSMVRRFLFRGYTDDEIKRLEKLDSLIIGKESLIKNISIYERLLFTSLDFENDEEIIEDYKSCLEDEEVVRFQELIDIIKNNF